MNKPLMLMLIFLIAACGHKTETKAVTDDPGQGQLVMPGESSYEKINLDRPAVIIIQLDSLELERLKETVGETIFYTGSDDLLWYKFDVVKKNGLFANSRQIFRKRHGRHSGS